MLGLNCGILSTRRQVPVTGFSEMCTFIPERPLITFDAAVALSGSSNLTLFYDFMELKRNVLNLIKLSVFYCEPLGAFNKKTRVSIC